MIDQGFILAAGFGKRMMPLTEHMPKPMVPIKGKPMIAYALAAFAAHGLKRVVINTHYLADVLHDYLASQTYPFELIISHELTLLDTGGGLKNGFKKLDAAKPAFVLSGDSILCNGTHATALNEMQTAWDNTNHDILLSLQPVSSMTLTKGVGDYKLVDSVPVRTPDLSGDYMWNSARIIHPRAFDNTPDGPFSFLDMMDDAQTKGRLGAIIHDGLWHHLTNQADVERVNTYWGGA